MRTTNTRTEVFAIDGGIEILEVAITTTTTRFVSGDKILALNPSDIWVPVTLERVFANDINSDILFVDTSGGRYRHAIPFKGNEDKAYNEL